MNDPKTMFLLISEDREHGGRVVHGIFSTKEKANQAIKQIDDIEYWRIPFTYELEVDKFYQEK